ncbi:adenosine 5'-monophosphoramidase HINT3-like isoform X2 [Ostrea edulis]|uniref:adenosine 5'-monophosphoramidase HINT3-like isoform X2 n=1 Tax=Ostrea edulis TaxID=37623 RepID=UPI0024AF94A5|nr:adenosine 5'-monophosphoramidase HINT3-like isoform X2 [Ostrea edulis]
MSTDGNNCMISCVFCKIANLQDPETRILYQDEEFVAFRDIRPAADHHYLIVTKQHIKDPKQLRADDLQLLERLIVTGENVLKNAGGALEETRVLVCRIRVVFNKIFWMTGH